MDEHQYPCRVAVRGFSMSQRIFEERLTLADADHLEKLVESRLHQMMELYPEPTIEIEFLDARPRGSLASLRFSRITGSAVQWPVEVVTDPGRNTAG